VTCAASTSTHAVTVLAGECMDKGEYTDKGKLVAKLLEGVRPRDTLATAVGGYLRERLEGSLGRCPTHGERVPFLGPNRNGDSYCKECILEALRRPGEAVKATE